MLKKRFIILAVFILIIIPLFSQDIGEVDDEKRDSEENTGNIESGETNYDFLSPLTNPEDIKIEEFQNTNGELDFSDGLDVWSYIRMIATLGIIIIAIYLFIKFLKKTSTPAIDENEIIKLLSSKTIGPNRMLHLVEVGKEMFLIGAGDNTISIISEIKDKESIDEIRLKATSERVTVKKNFREIFTGLFNFKAIGIEKTKEKKISILDSVDNLKKQRDRLKKM